MNKIALLPQQARQDIFSDAASELGIRPTIVEKDFWVCLVLKILFTASPFKDRLVFKGGTSLSKVFGLIERFSEDIDLVLDWQLIGYGKGLKDPMPNFASNTQQDKFNKEANQLAAVFISQTLVPALDELLQRTGTGLTAKADTRDLQIVNVHYPAAFSEQYIRPEVRLEIGPLGSWIPSANYTVQPYAFQVLPHLFEDPNCPVLATTAERTFWEKATILHQEAHRQSLIPSRHSRHYYDLYKLALSSVRESALADLNLLKDVVQFKQRFYPSSWARYDLAVPGSFKLLPSSRDQIRNLQQDYEDMQLMLFGNPPTFGEILGGLQELEDQLNAL